MNKQLKNVCLLIFHRPEIAPRMFERIWTQYLPYLKIGVNGPWARVANDAEKCRPIREILNRINSGC